MQKNTYQILENIIFKLVSILNKRGKRVLSEKVVTTLFLEISNKKLSPIRLILFAIEVMKPLVLIKQVKIRGLSFTVPYPQSKQQQFAFTLRLIIQTVKTNKKKISKALTEEFINIYRGKSILYSEITKLNSLAIKNKTFSFYRWF